MTALTARLAAALCPRAQVGSRSSPAVYRRHREHVWLDHSIGHLERILEAKGLHQRLDTPPCVCFVDLTGFTRLTEEQGDAAAAELAGRLGALVEGISRRHGGRPVRWLGDGGMFVFQVWRWSS